MSSHIWVDVGTVMQAVAPFVGPAAIVYAAWKASNTYEGWRRQKLSERRIEQAERILTAAYKARRALAFVRSPLMYSHELDAAEKYLEAHYENWSSVLADRKKRLTKSQSYYNRLKSVLDERKAVEECLPMARALFGENVEAALETLNKQFQFIGISIDANSWDGNERDFQKSIREDLSSASGTDKPNKMNEIIEAQVKIIEDRCVPVLRLVM